MHEQLDPRLLTRPKEFESRKDQRVHVRVGDEVIPRQKVGFHSASDDDFHRAWNKARLVKRHGARTEAEHVFEHAQLDLDLLGVRATSARRKAWIVVEPKAMTKAEDLVNEELVRPHEEVVEGR